MRRCTAVWAVGSVHRTRDVEAFLVGLVWVASKGPIPPGPWLWLWLARVSVADDDDRAGMVGKTEREMLLCRSPTKVAYQAGVRGPGSRCWEG